MELAELIFSVAPMLVVQTEPFRRTCENVCAGCCVSDTNRQLANSTIYGDKYIRNLACVRLLTIKCEVDNQ